MSRQATSKPKLSAEQFRALNRNSFGSYFLFLNPSFHYAHYQQVTFIPELQALERGEFAKLAVILPFGHSKSIIGTQNFAPWYLGRSPHKSVIVTCYGKDLSDKFGDDIRNQIASDKHRAIFPECELTKTSRAKDYFKLTAGGEFFAVPLDGAMNGKRADLIIIDDPLKNIEEAYSESRLQHLYDLYFSIVKSRLKPGGQILLNTTRYSMRDFFARLMEAEGELWRVLTLQAEPDPENEPGKYLWSEFYDAAWYEERKRDPIKWAAHYQLDPQPAVAQRFDLEWLMGDENGNGGCIYREPIPPGKFNTYMIVDPSLGKKETLNADFTCILVLAAGPEKRLFLVDAMLDRVDPGVRAQEIIRLHRIWACKQILYEEYGAMADTYFLKLAMEAEGIMLHPTSVGGRGSQHNLSKERRIWQLIPDFRDGRIWLPPTMKRVRKSDGVKMDIIKRFVEEEYLPYAGEGSVPHDDMLDAFARIHDDAFHPDHASPDEEYEHDGWEGRGSWEVL